MIGARCNLPVLDAEDRARVCGATATMTRTVEDVEFSACAACAAALDAGEVRREAPAIAEQLDFAEPAAVRHWLADLRLAFDDADAVTTDALRPVHRRELGRVLHRTNYRDARERIESLLAYAARSVGDRPAGAS
jgi:hypothetical protein